jgi:phosphoglycolate phosphatase
MKQKVILFDLDGTLTDSGEGIFNCCNLALAHFGITIDDPDLMRTFVGPPLRYSFARFGVPEDQIEEAIRIYRARYNTVGKYENFPYPGIQDLLGRLKSEGHRLFVATSKPESMSCDILNKFEMSHYFEKICGACMDGVRDTKDKVIAYLLDEIGPQQDIVMIGDTKFDVLGAAAHKIPTIGVSWGYGTMESMREAGAVSIANNMDELYQLIHDLQT